jgi:hypothetical protein
MAFDPEVQTQVDSLVAEVTAKFDAEKKQALDAAKAESDAAIAAAKKEGQGELLLVLKSAFGLPG